MQGAADRERRLPLCLTRAPSVWVAESYGQVLPIILEAGDGRNKESRLSRARYGGLTEAFYGDSHR
jgi:hypothetical protein